jgi:hypothetical protein
MSIKPNSVEHLFQDKPNPMQAKDLCSLDVALKLSGFSASKLADFAGEGSLRVFAHGALYKDRAKKQSTTYPVSLIQLLPVEAGHVLANYPFEEIAVAHPRFVELDIVIRPLNLRFDANEARSLAESEPQRTQSLWPWGDYQTVYLEALAAAVSEFFGPKRNQDAKRYEVVPWIEEKLLVAGIANA